MSERKTTPSPKRLSRLRFSKKALGKSVRSIEKQTVRHARRFVSLRLDRLAAIRRSVLGWLLLVLLLIGVSVFQWVNFRHAYSTTAPEAGGIYSEGVLGPLETVNPIFARSSAERSAARLLFAGLFSYDSSGHLKGELAKSMTVNPEETVYTVTLHDNLKWSDGAALTAADVVFTVNLLKQSATGATISGWDSFTAEQIDAKTVAFTLPTTYAPFRHGLTFPVLPKHVLDGVPAAELREHPFSQSPVTSGPFAVRIVQNVTPDGSKKIVHMVANPYYAKGQPKLERFQLNVYSQREEIEKALRTAEIMATPELQYAELPADLKNMYANQPYAINDGVYAIFNTTSETLQDVKVRQALALSVDTAKLRQEITRSSAPLEGPVLHDQVGVRLPAGPRHDLAKAKALLDESGWVVTDGVRAKGGVKLTLKAVALKGAGFSQSIEALAKLWREELHIEVEIEIVDPLDPSRSVLQDVLQPRNFDVLVYQFVLGGDPDAYAYWHSTQASATGRNFANYKQAVSDDALASGRSRLDEKKRADRYAAFVRRWFADAPAVPLYRPQIDYIHLPSVEAIGDGMKMIHSESRYANVQYWTVRHNSVYKTP